MTTFQIKCFLAVANHLNFTEAANELFIAQSSLSRNISNLEKEIEMQLFVRTKKYVRLTSAGAILYEEFDQLLKQLETVLDKARKYDKYEKNTLSLGIIESQKTDAFLPRVLHFLQERYPNITLEFFRGNFKELRDYLGSGNIDIAITLSFDLESYLPMNVVYQSFLISAPLCAVSKSHPLAGQETVRLDDLHDDDLISISPGISSGAYLGMIELCKLQGFTPRQIKTVSSMEQVALMLQTGQGFSITDENSSLMNNESIRCLPIRNGNTLNLVAVWKKENYNPAIPLFVNFLTDQEP